MTTNCSEWNSGGPVRQCSPSFEILRNRNRKYRATQPKVVLRRAKKPVRVREQLDSLTVKTPSHCGNSWATWSANTKEICVRDPVTCRRRTIQSINNMFGNTLLLLQFDRASNACFFRVPGPSCPNISAMWQRLLCLMQRDRSTLSMFRNAPRLRVWVRTCDTSVTRYV